MSNDLRELHSSLRLNNCSSVRAEFNLLFKVKICEKTEAVNKPISDELITKKAVKYEKKLTCGNLDKKKEKN